MPEEEQMITKSDLMEAAMAGARELVNEVGMKELKPSAQALADAKAVTDELSPTILIARLQAAQEALDTAIQEVRGFTAQVASLEDKLRKVTIYQAIINERVRVIYETMELRGTVEVGGRIRNLTSDQVHQMVDKKVEWLKEQAARGNVVDTKAGV